MPIYRPRIALAILAALAAAGCGTGTTQNSNRPAASPRDVPAVRLNYKYEADVPAPSAEPKAAAEEHNPAVQFDFDNTRPQELLDRTITSPDKKHVLAVYHRVTDTPSEFRLDMYTGEGQPLKKMTSDAMAVHFPETIVWSPDSNSVAFVAMIRVIQPDTSVTPTPAPAEGDENVAASPAPPPMQAPTGILAFRSEQVYMANADGGGVKPLTQNEGLIYFYYTWSPDSTMLAAMATTVREWKYFETLAAGKGEQLVPSGRPRIIEKNGRERRLDDNQTPILPVWSPDSTKVAVAFDVEINDAQNAGKKRRDTQIRIYDAAGTNPTQAAIPMRNQLLISSAAYDRNLHRLESSNSLPDNSAQPSPEGPSQLSTLPDESELVSYNAIVEIAWPSDDLLYFETAYVKRMVRESDNVTSFARWHRLVLSAQAATTPKQR
jgi:hypothetical protein